jgi:hypothetical protein
MVLAGCLISAPSRPGCVIVPYVWERLLFEVEVWLDLRYLTHTAVKTVHYNTDVAVGRVRTNRHVSSCYGFCTC